MKLGYTDSFGLQWNRFRRVQLDSYSGTTISRDRLFSASGWPSDLTGHLILEAGSGAGRFTEVLLRTGARIISMDLSTAVRANRLNNPSERALIVQADIHRIPCRAEAFDHVLCLGVLQHCPDVEAAFRSLVPFIKPGGDIVIDVYDIETKQQSTVRPGYVFRQVTTRMPPALLLRLVRWSVPSLLTVKRGIRWLSRRMRYVGLLYAWIPVFDYRGELPLSEKQLREWAVLDTYDFLGARFDQPQHIDNVRRWFTDAGLDVEYIGKGANGIVARGRKPA